MERRATWVLRFDQIGEGDGARVGGKAASLGELTRAGFAVPEGFVVTTDALHAGARDEVDQAITEAWSAMFAADTPLAVRSSGTKEDLEGASFAGLYETVLGVRGRDALLAAVRRCWASLEHPRVREYAERRAGGADDLSMAVVVQRMIPADVAGVLFTVNPLTGREEEVLIEAAFGLGEALVSGRVNADRFVVDPRDGTVKERHIAEKTLRIDALPGGGTTETHLAGEAARAPTLDDAALAELAELGAAIQEHYGRPMDVELVREKGRFYVVQARPITRLTFAPGSGEWTTADFKDGGVASDVCSPFMWSLYQLALEASFPAYFKDIKMLEPDAEETWGRMWFARPYWNLGVVRRMVSQLPDYNQRKFDTDLGIEPTYEGDGQVTGLTPATLVRALPVLFALRRSFVEVLERARRFVAGFEADTAPWELSDEGLRALGPRSFADAWRRLITERYFDTETTYFTVIYNTSNSKTDFNGALEAAKKACGGELDVLALMSGLENLSHMRPLAEIHEIAGRLRREGRALDDETVRAFAWRWRHHGRKELDIRVPRWCEEPELVRQMLQAALDDFDAEQHPAASAKRAHEAYVRERDRAAAALGFLARRKFLAGLERVRTYAWWREEVRDRSSYMYYLVRRWSLEAARRFVERGWLHERDDVWYLPFQDALALADGTLAPDEARRRVRAGRRMVRSFRHFKNPPEIGVGYGMAKAAPAGALRGIGCSPGRVEGRARVVHSLAEMGRVEHGDILVTHFTDPGWTPLFARLGGVVTETGGVLAHAAVISREYGIPAVLAVPGATERIKDGARVAVDGTHGTIEIVG